MKNDQIKFRIIKEDGKILNAGTDKPSWFTLKQAQKLRDYSKKERIFEYHNGKQLWEIC